MKKCLIVDDDLDDVHVASRLMKSLGFEVETAADGEVALAMCRQRMPDCILLDYVMPKVDGLEFMKLLQRTRGGDRPAIVFCTRCSDEAALGAAIWYGASECLVKPYDGDLLAFKLAQIGVIDGSLDVAA